MIKWSPPSSSRATTSTTIITPQCSRDLKRNSFSNSAKKPANKPAQSQTSSLTTERDSLKSTTAARTTTPLTDSGPSTKSVSPISVVICSSENSPSETSMPDLSWCLSLLPRWLRLIPFLWVWLVLLLLSMIHGLQRMSGTTAPSLTRIPKSFQDIRTSSARPDSGNFPNPGTSDGRQREPPSPLTKSFSDQRPETLLGMEPGTCLSRDSLTQCTKMPNITISSPNDQPHDAMYLIIRFILWWIWIFFMNGCINDGKVELVKFECFD